MTAVEIMKCVEMTQADLTALMFECMQTSDDVPSVQLLDDHVRITLGLEHPIVGTCRPKQEGDAFALLGELPAFLAADKDRPVVAAIVIVQ